MEKSFAFSPKAEQLLGISKNFTEIQNDMQSNIPENKFKFMIKKFN